MNEFVGISIAETASTECSKCGMPESEQGGCCKNETYFVKLTDDHKASFYDAKVTLHNLQIAVVQPLNSSTLEPLIYTFFNKWPQSHAPPNSCVVPLYVQHCSYLI
jgi:hypothetical protein